MSLTPCSLPFIFFKQMKVNCFFFILVFSSLLYSCGDSKECCTPPPLSYDYSQGVFVVNEGSFGGTGTISWFNPSTGEVRDSIYEKANNGASLGQFVQSLTFHQGKAYIVVSGANRVVVVNAASFEYLDTIGNLQIPRYFLPVGQGTAYISQWGNDGLSGSVAKVDLTTNEVITAIPTGKGPERMVLVNDRVYVANSGGYGLDSTITEISVANESVQTYSASGGKNPGDILWVQNGPDQKLFYLCKGYFLDSSPQGSLNYLGNPGSGLSIPAFSDDLVHDPNTGFTYFIGENTVYKLTQNGADLTSSPLFNASLYTLALDSEAGVFYCGDARDFTSNGEVVIRQLSGTYISSFRAGVAPGQIIIVR